MKRNLCTVGLGALSLTCAASVGAVSSSPDAIHNQCCLASINKCVVRSKIACQNSGGIDMGSGTCHPDPCVRTPPPCHFPATWQITTRVSVASDGTQGNARSEAASISADGRLVAFESIASNLVKGDTNVCGGGNPGPPVTSCSDVFVHDRLTGGTERVSVGSDGTQGNASSEAASISADGRFVAFESLASNLVSGVTGLLFGVYVHDRLTGVTELASVASDGTPATSAFGPSLSANGRFVAFSSDASNLVAGGMNGGVFVHDRQTGVTEQMDVASDGTPSNGGSQGPATISADGRFVAFASAASNLVTGDTNACSEYFILPGSCPDIFVHDRQTGVTERVSVASDGTQGDFYSARPSISADGRLVAFESYASNLVSGDTNGTSDIFVHDRLTGLTQRVSVASDGTQGDSGSFFASISQDGRFVAFASGANLGSDVGDVPGSIFVHDRMTGVTERVSVAVDGTPANGGTGFGPSISAFGRFVAFDSDASNLVSGDTNGQNDVFVHGPLCTSSAMGRGVGLYR